MSWVYHTQVGVVLGIRRRSRKPTKKVIVALFSTARWKQPYAQQHGQRLNCLDGGVAAFGVNILAMCSLLPAFVLLLPLLAIILALLLPSRRQFSRRRPNNSARASEGRIACQCRHSRCRFFGIELTATIKMTNKKATRYIIRSIGRLATCHLINMQEWFDFVSFLSRLCLFPCQTSILVSLQTYLLFDDPSNGVLY